MILSMRYANSKNTVDLTNDLLQLEQKLKNSPVLRQLFLFWAEQFATPALKQSAATYLTPRTGKLVERARVRLSGTRDRNYRVTIGAPYVPYALIQETGGKITPKKAQYLTVPISGSPADVWPRRKARSFDRTFVAKGRGKDSKIIYQKVGKKEIVPLFALKKLVNIPPSKWMTRGMENAMPILRQLLMEAKLL